MPRKLDFTVRNPHPRSLDLWLVDHLQDFSRSRIQTLITDGHITVNQGPAIAKPSSTPATKSASSSPKPNPSNSNPKTSPSTSSTKTTT